MALSELVSVTGMGAAMHSLCVLEEQSHIPFTCTSIIYFIKAMGFKHIPLTNAHTCMFIERNMFISEAKK